MVSKTRLWKEFQETWNEMKELVEKTTEFLEEEVKGPLTSGVHGAREGRTNVTRHMLLWEHSDKQVVEALEKAVVKKVRRLF